MNHKLCYRNRIYFLLTLLAAAITVILAIYAPSWLGRGFNWGIVAIVVTSLLILAFFYEFEARKITSREIALISMMGTLSAVSRIPFAPIPSVQPATFIIICTGYVFGPLAGFMTGALTAIISNLFLGHGPWTLFQIFGWGMAGVIPGIIPRNRACIWILAFFGLAWGYIYGVIVNIWAWASLIYPLTWQTFLLSMLNSVWFDTMHGVANVLFIAILGKRTISIMERWSQRFLWRIDNPIKSAPDE
ncbi:MAG: ECF transporter S component [Dehalococcoidales bacterium]|nr:ECF transporter S component [Dehalococcoidales bacterium]